MESKSKSKSWSHLEAYGDTPTPPPLSSPTLTATATAAGEFFLFRGFIGHAHRRASCDLYVFSTRSFFTTLLRTSGEVPTPRAAHGAALIRTTTLLVCGGEPNLGDQNVLNDDSPYLLNLGTSDLLISSPTPADHSFALQYHESGAALWSMVLDRAVATTQPQPWPVPSSSSSVVCLAGSPSMICGSSI
jgi:hypothetical protein